MKKKGYFLVGILVIMFGAITLLGSSEEIASVEGYKIIKEEVAIMMQKNKAIVANQFVVDKGIQYGEDFWETPIEGKTPEQVLYEVALEEMIEVKKKQVLALEWGIEQDISYEAFEKQLEEENNRRKEKLSKGEVIYGPKEYQLQEYYSYCNKNREIALCDAIISQGKITEKEINDYYENNKNLRYKIPDTYTLNIKKMNEKGEVVESHQVVMNKENIREYDKRYSGFMGMLEELEENELRNVKDFQNNAYEIFCQQREEAGAVLIEEVRDNIKEVLAKQKLEEILQKQEVVINK